MVQIETVVRVRGSYAKFFLSEDDAILNFVTSVANEPNRPIAICFPDFSLNYQPVSTGDEFTGLLILHSHSSEKLDEIRLKIQTLQDELNGNQSGESTL